MDLTTFTYKIILIFFPGIISLILYDQLTSRKECKPERIFLLSFVFGVTSYLFSFIIYYLITFITCAYEIIYNKLPLFETFKNNFYIIHNHISNTHIFNQNHFNIDEIFLTTILSFIIIPILSFISNHKILINISRKYNITNDHGHVDVLSFLFNSDEVEWIIVRDKETDITYYGWLHSFSDGTGKDEMLLRDVKVYMNGIEIYETEWLYLSYIREKIIIESPKYSTTNNISHSNDDTKNDDKILYNLYGV